MSLHSSTVVTAPTAAASVYTSGGNTAIHTMYFCNPTAATITANIFLVRSGFTANGMNITYSNIQIASNDTLILETERLSFDNGDYMAANAEPAGLVSTVSWLEI
jgi:hypothetical protein